MRRREHYWSLYHQPEKRQLDDMRTDYVEAVFEALPVSTHGDWLVWREGFRSWKPLSDFPALLIGLRVQPTGKALPSANVAAPSVPEATTSATISARTSVTAAKVPVFDAGSSDGGLSLAEETDLNDRDTRFQKKWDLRIHNGNQVLLNQTVDVSVKGMQLRDPLPATLPNYFNVEISIGESAIPVVCSVMKTHDKAGSRKLRIEVNDYAHALQAALLRQ